MTKSAESNSSSTLARRPHFEIWLVEIPSDQGLHGPLWKKHPSYDSASETWGHLLPPGHDLQQLHFKVPPPPHLVPLSFLVGLGKIMSMLVFSNASSSNSWELSCTLEILDRVILEQANFHFKIPKKGSMRRLGAQKTLSEGKRVLPHYDLVRLGIPRVNRKEATVHHFHWYPRMPYPQGLQW